MMRDIGTIVSAILVIVFMLGFLALLWGLPTMWLWNWLMPHLFGLKTVSFGQAIGINLLAGILFKSPASSYSAKKD